MSGERARSLRDGSLPLPTPADELDPTTPWITTDTTVSGEPDPKR